MKILYIGMKYDYGNPERGFSFEHYNFYDSLVHMDEKKNVVVYFPFDEIMQKYGREEMNRKLIEAVEIERPDFCFFFLFTDEIDKETISTISGRGDTVTYNWFADDHWRFYNFSKYWAPLFNWVSTTDSYASEKYRNLGYKNVIRTQWACNHFLYKPTIDLMNTVNQYEFDASFVGQPHSDRRTVVESLKHEGVCVVCFGGGWPNGRISQERMIDVFSKSKFNINFTQSSSESTVRNILKIFLHRSKERYRLNGPRGLVDNFKSFRGKRRQQIKGRTFEVPGSGGLLMSAPADDLLEYYEEGKEIVVFRDTNDLVKKIKYYLAHEDERLELLLAGYRRTIKDHTYERRFRDIFCTIGISTYADNSD